MEHTKENSLIKGWFDQVEELLLNGKSIAIAIFNTNGNLLDANSAMCYFLDTDMQHLSPNYSFVNPDFSTFVTGETGLVFDGLLTIGNHMDISYVLNSKVFRREAEIMVFAEADVPYLFEENKKMSILNQQVNNLQRQLIKEKKDLQNTVIELKETQQMLIHSEKMNAMGKLVAGVAHELNNPVSFVYSNIFSLEKYIAEIIQSYHELEELISKQAGDLTATVAELREKNDLNYLLNDIVDMTRESKIGIERVKTIVEDLRRFSRLDESEIKQVDLIENIMSTISVTRSEIAQKNIQFNLSAPNRLQVECYPGQLNQAILNILINAVDAVDLGGNILMRVATDDKNVIIEVKDDGCGISKEILSRIFDPFFTTKPVGKGTGLGLSITYKIIHDLHHGNIEAVSAPGHGTNIRLSIPGKI